MVLGGVGGGCWRGGLNKPVPEKDTKDAVGLAHKINGDRAAAQCAPMPAKEFNNLFFVLTIRKPKINLLFISKS